MPWLKNNKGITKHLQRIFYYGEDRMERSRVDDFMTYLDGLVDSETGEPYDVSPRSIYSYIIGQSQFPVDLLLPLARWSGDSELHEAYELRTSYDAQEKMRVKLEEKLAERAGLDKDIERLKDQLAGVEQHDLPFEDNAKGVPNGTAVGRSRDGDTCPPMNLADWKPRNDDSKDPEVSPGGVSKRIVAPSKRDPKSGVTARRDGLKKKPGGKK